MIPFVATVIYNEKTREYYLDHDFPDRFQIHLAKLKGKRATVKITKFYKLRTPPQMGYLYGCVLPIAAACMGYKRYQRDQCYLALKSMFLKASDEHGREYVISLAENSNDPVHTKQMEDFMEQIRDLIAMEYGVHIPPPDKDYTKGYIEELVTEIEQDIM